MYQTERKISTNSDPLRSTIEELNSTKVIPTHYKEWTFSKYGGNIDWNLNTDDMYINLVTAYYGHYVGISSGEVFATAEKIIREEKSGNVLIIFPDSGNRYTNILGGK